MAYAVIVLVIVALVLWIAWLKTPQGVTWADGLTRLQPGRRGHAEWMAPNSVLEQVQQEYLAACAWAQVAQTDRARWRAEMDRYFSGPFLSLQQRRLEALNAARGLSLDGVITGTHQLTVRAFSSDGLTCLLVDYQTQRSMATVVRSGQRAVSQQRLDDRAMVYRMAYHRAERRWKIDELIQEFPAGWSAQPPTHGRVRLADDWPMDPGKDRRLAN